MRIAAAQGNRIKKVPKGAKLLKFVGGKILSRLDPITAAYDVVELFRDGRPVRSLQHAVKKAMGISTATKVVAVSFKACLPTAPTIIGYALCTTAGVGTAAGAQYAVEETFDTVSAGPADRADQYLQETAKQVAETVNEAAETASGVIETARNAVDAVQSAIDVVKRLMDSTPKF